MANAAYSTTASAFAVLSNKLEMLCCLSKQMCRVEVMQNLKQFPVTFSFSHSPRLNNYLPLTKCQLTEVCCSLFPQQLVMLLLLLAVSV